MPCNKTEHFSIKTGHSTYAKKQQSSDYHIITNLAWYKPYLKKAIRHAQKLLQNCLAEPDKA